MLAWDAAGPRRDVTDRASRAARARRAARSTPPSSPSTALQKYAEACVAELGEIPFFKKTGDGKYDDLQLHRLDADPDDGHRRRRHGRPAPDQTVEQVRQAAVHLHAVRAGAARRARAPTTRARTGCCCAASRIGGTNVVAVQRHRDDRAQPAHRKDLLLPERALLQDRRRARAAPGRQGEVGEPVERRARRPRLGHRVRALPRQRSVHPQPVDRRREGQRRQADRAEDGRRPRLPARLQRRAVLTRQPQGQGWTMEKQLVSPEAAACTKCHRIGGGRWLQLDLAPRRHRLQLEFDRHHRLPEVREAALDAAAIYARGRLTEANWADSKFKKAIDFIKGCYQDASRCQWTDIPTGL